MSQPCCNVDSKFSLVAHILFGVESRLFSLADEFVYSYHLYNYAGVCIDIVIGSYMFTLIWWLKESRIQWGEVWVEGQTWKCVQVALCFI